MKGFRGKVSSSQLKGASHKMQKTEETPYKDDEALILIMGPSGSGKSTFINNYAKEDIAKVTHGFETCTKNIEVFAGSFPTEALPASIVEDYNVPQKALLKLVDTPGFFCTNDDSQTLQKIAEWVRPPKGPPRKLAGIIYLHDMTTKHLQIETKMSLSLFQQICGADAASRTVLVKTQWSGDEGTRTRAAELDGTFFKDMIKDGAVCATIKDGSDGVTEESIVHDILRKDTANRVVLQLLRELQEGKALQTTGAGKELTQSLILLLKGELDQRQFLIFKRALEQLTGKTITNPSRSQKLKGWMIRQFKLIA